MLFVDTQIHVRYKETDRMGIVHHSNYYVWFEVGRAEFMRQRGFSYSEMERRGFMLPIIEAHCIYRNGARYDDVVTIRTRMTQFKGARVTLEYEVIRGSDGVLLAEGKTVHAITDSNLKPVNIKKADPDIYRFLTECVSA